MGNDLTFFSIRDFKKALKHHNYSMVFQGMLSQEILTLVGQSLRNLPNNQIKAKRLFGLVIEMSQNIHHYSAQKAYSVKEEREIGVGILALGQTEDYHLISSGNYVDNVEIEKIKTRSDYINSMTLEELKEFYKQQRKAPQREGKPGANLGLIEMRRKSGNPVEVLFIDFDENVSFFILTLKISKGK